MLLDSGEFKSRQSSPARVSHFSSAHCISSTICELARTIVERNDLGAHACAAKGAKASTLNQRIASGRPPSALIYRAPAGHSIGLAGPLIARNGRASRRQLGDQIVASNARSSPHSSIWLATVGAIKTRGRVIYGPVIWLPFMETQRNAGAGASGHQVARVAENIASNRLAARSPVGPAGRHAHQTGGGGGGEAPTRKCGARVAGARFAPVSLTVATLGRRPIRVGAVERGPAE